MILDRLLTPIGAKIGLGVIALLLAGNVATGLLLMDAKIHGAKIQQRLTEEVAAHDRLKLEVAGKTALATASQQSKANRVERDQVVVNQGVISAYQSEIADLRRRAAARGVQPPATAADAHGAAGRGHLPGVPDAPGGADGAACKDGLPDADRLIASEIAVRLKNLQAWVRGQGAVQR